VATSFISFGTSSPIIRTVISGIINNLSPLTSSDAVYNHYSGIGYPWGAAVNAQGSLIVCDHEYSVVYSISPSLVVTHLAGTIAGAGNGTGLAVNAQINQPQYVTLDAAGNIYFTESYDVKVINTQTTTQTLFGVSVPAGNVAIVAGQYNSGGSSGTRGDGGPATSAYLEGVSQIVITPNGYLYITDQSFHKVRQVTTAGIISTVIGTGTPGHTGDGGPATSAELFGPTGLTCDTAGNLYVSDETYRVRAVNMQGTTQTILGVSGIASGNIQTVAGIEGTNGNTGNGGAATSAEIGSQCPLSVDTSGNLYICLGGFNVVRTVNVSGIINSFAGTGSSGNTGNGGPATSAKIYGPVGTAIGVVVPVVLAQKVVISGGNFQSPNGTPLALGTVQVSLQQDVAIGGVQLCAGIKDTLQLDANGNVTGNPTLWGPISYQMVPFSAKGERAIGYPALTVAIPNAPTYSLTNI
jgi:hypothetical protein